MSLMSRSKFGNSSTFIDDSDIIFVNDWIAWEVTMMMQNRSGHRLMEEVTVMTRHQQIFLISLSQRDWLEHLRHIFFGVFHHGVLSRDVSDSRYQICVTDNLSSFRFRCHKNYKQIKQRKKIKTEIERF